MRIKKGLTAVILIAALAVLGGCGAKVSNKTPQSAVKSLINSYQKQDEDAAKQCLGVDKEKKCPQDIQTEIDYNMKMFANQGAKNVKFKKSDTLGDCEGRELVYVWYNCNVKVNGENQKFPMLAFYFTGEKDGHYYVIPAKDVTKGMGEMSTETYEEFLKTKEYKKYKKAYDEFFEKNPEYEKVPEDKSK